MNISVISGNTPKLAAKIAKKLGAKIIQPKLKIFADGESKITIPGTISKDHCIIIQSLHPPVDTNIIQLLSLVAKAKENANTITIVVPYMGYARQDRAFLKGEVVTLRVLGQLFESVGVSSIIVVDMHSTIGLQCIPIKIVNVSAVPALAKYFTKLHIKDVIVVSPDQGGRERAMQFADLINVDCIVLQKRRDRETGRVQIMTKSNNKVVDKNVVLVDDMISTGGSIIKATEFLKKLGCKRVYVVCTHALLVDGAKTKIRKAGVTRIISADTIPRDVSQVDISDSIVSTISKLGV